MMSKLASLSESKPSFGECTPEGHSLVVFLIAIPFQTEPDDEALVEMIKYCWWDTAEMTAFNEELPKD